MKCLIISCFLLCSLIANSQELSKSTAQQYNSKDVHRKYKPDNPNILYSGRVAVSADSTSFYWPGSSARIVFEGTAVSIKMHSKRERGYFYAILDGNSANALKFGSDSILRTFVLAENLSYGTHSIELYKLSNCTSVNTFYGFDINGTLQVQDIRPVRKIEFYGNSITAGHGVDVAEGSKDSGAPQYYNNYYTYAAITSRHFNAQASYIARGGIGIMVSWFPEIMPETYTRIDPLDSTSNWDFKKFRPDVVVINLFQNDSWLVNTPTHEQFKRRFGSTKPTDEYIIASYRTFVSSIRSKYPQAHIICALGNMDATKPDSKWPGYIQKATEGLNDSKIYTIFFPYKNTDGHPKRSEQQSMADQLIEFINNNIKW